MVMKYMKRVILHIGVHKTGTSALQAVFAQGRDHMRQKGIAYPHPDPDSVVATRGCSGNAIQILFASNPAIQGNAIVPPMATDGYFRALREAVDCQPENTVLISGEFLGSLNASQVAMLKAALSGHSVEVVVFVRDPFDYAFSCWRQKVKGRSFEGTFEEFIASPERQLSMRNGFINFSQAFVRIHVLRYERYKSNLAAAFFNAIGRLDAMPDTKQVTERIHNPSLSPSEASLCVALAKGLKSANFVSFASRMLLARSERHDHPFYSQRLHEITLTYFGTVIDKINKRLPSEDRLSKVVRASDGPDSGILPEDVTFALELLKLNVLGKHARSPAEDRKDNSSGLPENFDAVAYLILNPDVAEARMDPVEHYLRHGQGEMRRYSLF